MRLALKQCRHRKGLTQAQVAAHLDRTKSLISQYESGHIDPPTSVLLRLARLYEVSLDELCGRPVPTTPAPAP